MRQAQQMREQMEYLQKGLETKEVEGNAGSGLVKVRMNGSMRVIGVEIRPDAMSEDREMLQDLVTAAFNQALDRCKELTQNQMAGVIPPGLLGNFPGM